MTDVTTTPADPETELKRSMTALYLAADASVAEYHNKLTMAVIDKQRAELDEAHKQFAALREEHKQTLDALEVLTNSDKFQESCPHDAEPDFCDQCALEREKKHAEAKKTARARLRVCGRKATP